MSRADTGCVSVPIALYRRAALHCERLDVRVRAWLREILRDDLAANGFPAVDPGKPKIRRIHSREPYRGRRRSIHIEGVTYRRSRVYAHSLGRSMSDYVVEVMTKAMRTPNIIARRRHTPRVIEAERVAVAEDPERARRCAAALEAADMSSGGVHLL